MSTTNIAPLKQVTLTSSEPVSAGLAFFGAITGERGTSKWSCGVAKEGKGHIKVHLRDRSGLVALYKQGEEAILTTTTTTL